MDGVVTNYMTVWQQIRDSIKGKRIRAPQPGPVPTVTLEVRDDFFNVQPELRNSKRNLPKYPGLLLTLMTPTLSSNFVVQEWQRTSVDVEATAPYLEGVGQPTLAMADGQTFELRVGRLNTAGGETQQTITLTMQTASFDDITAATPLEIAAAMQVQLVGIAHVTVDTVLNRVRIQHNDASSRATLRVVGGTATALVASFPTYQSTGRDAGPETRYLLPPVYYNFPFRVTHKSNRFDHYALLHQLVMELFLHPLSKSNKYLEVANKRFEVREERPIDSHVPTEGLFVTTQPFTLVNIPFSHGETFFINPETGEPLDDFNGGNFDGTGSPSLPQFPPGPLEIEFEVNEVGPQESL